MEDIRPRLCDLVIDLGVRSKERLATGRRNVVRIHGQDVTAISVERLSTGCVRRERAPLRIVSDVLLDVLNVNWEKESN